MNEQHKKMYFVQSALFELQKNTNTAIDISILKIIKFKSKSAYDIILYLPAIYTNIIYTYLYTYIIFMYSYVTLDIIVILSI